MCFVILQECFLKLHKPYAVLEGRNELDRMLKYLLLYIVFRNAIRKLCKLRPFYHSVLQGKIIAYV